MQMIDYNSKDLVQILTKIDTDNRLWMTYKFTKFHLDWCPILQVTVIFSSVRKDKEEKEKKWRKKLENLLTHISKMLYTIFFKFGV